MRMQGWGRVGGEERRGRVCWRVGKTAVAVFSCVFVVGCGTIVGLGTWLVIQQSNPSQAGRSCSPQLEGQRVVCFL